MILLDHVQSICTTTYHRKPFIVQYLMGLKPKDCKLRQVGVAFAFFSTISWPWPYTKCQASRLFNDSVVDVIVFPVNLFTVPKCGRRCWLIQALQHIWLSTKLCSEDGNPLLLFLTIISRYSTCSIRSNCLTSAYA